MEQRKSRTELGVKGIRIADSTLNRIWSYAVDNKISPLVDAIHDLVSKNSVGKLSTERRLRTKGTQGKAFVNIKIEDFEKLKAMKEGTTETYDSILVKYLNNGKVESLK